MTTTTTRNDDLVQLAERYGVATSYYDWKGQHIEVPADTLTAVLTALDVDVTDADAIAASLRAADEGPWREAVPATTVNIVGSKATVQIHVPDGLPVAVTVQLEDGGQLPLEQVENWNVPREINGTMVGEASFRIPTEVPLGWHHIVATITDARMTVEQAELLGYAAGTDGGYVASGALIAAPQRPSLAIDEPVWGLMTQLYQVRSQQSWGAGDLADLRALGAWGAERDADFVLINPVHAPAPVLPMTPSPYLPTTRRFIDPSISNIDDLKSQILGSATDGESLDATAVQRLDELAADAATANAADTIDRDRTWEAKREALWLLFDAAVRVDGDRWDEFGEFCEFEGEGLMNFATWCVLAEQLGSDWRRWPQELQSPETAEVEAFRQQHALRVQFYCWLQFEVRSQSVATQEALRASGMTIGVMRDLAVGVEGTGADTWALGPAMARGVTVGAPPDAFNQLGQNWGQPPLRPDSLYRQGYEPMRALLRNAFAGAGALRIDHILGFFRLWWVPEGAAAHEGTYVAYDYDAMLGVLLLEADRAGALVVGEDLGVVSDLTREQMRERHVFGTQIMWFEHAADEGPKDPADYRVECLATVTTHDLPPTAGYLELAHVDLREQLGLYTRPVAEERADEKRWVDAHLTALRDGGFIGEDESTAEVVLALHRRLAGGASKLFGVSVADLAGDRRSINQPGTDREYANWRLPLADAQGQVVGLEQLIASPFADALARAASRPR